MADPKALEAGVLDSSQPFDAQPRGADKLTPDSSSSRGSPEPAPLPEQTERSTQKAVPKDGLWDKITGQANNQDRTYKPPPAKGSRYELETFQNLVGIHFLRPGGGELWEEHQGKKPASPMHDIFLPTKAAAKRWRNRGLYDRSLSQDVKNRVLYGMSTYLISFLYLLQILIAAALTGLSAYQQSSSVALTVLGAINTVLAGILAWLNGQGMPTRFRRARDLYREVVRAIEDMERTFAEIDYVEWAPGTRPNPYAARDKLEAMYEEARQDQERNYPDIQEGPDKVQMQDKAEGLKANVAEQKEKVGLFAKELEDARKGHKEQLKELERGFAEKFQRALKEQEGRIRDKVQFEHLQKVAEEAKRKYEEEKAEWEGRKPRKQAREPSPRARELAKAAEKPREDGRPREGAPGQAPREAPRQAPREAPHEKSRPAPRSAPREAPREKSPARSRARSPSRPRAASPVPAPTAVNPRAASPARSPVRSKSPVRSISRSRSRSPAKPRSKSPIHPKPAKSPSPPPARPARSPSRSRARSPARGTAPPPPRSRSPSSSSADSGDRPGKKGPPGLFTNF